MSNHPLILLYRALSLWVSRKLELDREPTSMRLVYGGEPFAAFRKVIVKPCAPQPEPPGAIFQVRFEFKNLSTRANRLLSLIPIPFIVAQPGFRSKTWLLGERSGDFIGLYEFDTVEAAEAYWSSLPMKMMRRRAAPGSLRRELRPAAP
ncbi:MAG: hypothetical protein JRI23_25415 [Deltaproteobacteria bacterium]|jgi:hypothetical protein|nr:hypothetical protein [Deltaproteobacteria bacterium]MBW2535358.1 hypothetical protein [Deltaproteobacteria bacterium]